MHTFQYRAPRFRVELPVRLALEKGTVAGRCIEISIDGMRAQFSPRLSVNDSGTIFLSHRGLSIGVPARVIHVGADFEALRFQIENERDRKILERLVAALSTSTPKRGPVLVN